MISVLIITHGQMAAGMADSVQMIMGPQEQFGTLGLLADESVDSFKEKVYEKIVAADQSDGVLIFTDLYGASPFNSVGGNLARLTEEGHQIRVITGVNLPMVLETMNARNYMETLSELYQNAVNTGKEGIRELLEDIGA